MPALTWYELGSIASGSGFLALQEGGTAPGAARMSPITGWNNHNNIVGDTSNMDAQSEVTTFDANSTNPKPIAPDNTLGNGFRSPLYATMTSAAGNWTISFIVGSDTVAGVGGRLRVRVWRSASATGGSPTEITSSPLVTSTSGALSTTAGITISVTWAAPAFSLTNEYLFFTVAHESTQRDISANSTADFVLRTGSAAAFTAPDISFDITPPPVPTWGTATPGNNRAYLDWNDVTAGDLAGYNLYRDTASGGTFATKVNGTLLGTSTYTDTGLTNGTPLYYKASSVDLVGNESAKSASISVTPAASPPASPTGLTTTGFTKNTVGLSWNANGEGDLSHYNVYQSTTSGSGYVKINGANVTGTTYTATGLSTGTTYYFVVRAVDTESAEGSNSNQVSEQPRFTPPAIPTGLARDEFDTYVNLSWSANSEGDLAGYNLYRTTTSGTGYTKLNTGGVLTGLTYQDVGLTNGTVYYYVLTAQDTEGGESGYSNEVAATPRPPERLYPNGFVSTNLTGPVTNVQDDPDAPDANWLTITDPSGATTTSAARYPTTNALVVTGFTSPTNVYADDNTEASAAPGKNASITHNFGGFGFDSVVPVGSTVQSIEVTVGWRSSAVIVDLVGGFQPYVGGAAQGTEATSTSIPTTETQRTATFTGLTRDNILDANFQLRLRATRANVNTAYTLFVDYVRITVTYQAPGSTVNTEGWFTMTGLSVGRQLRTGANLQQVKVQVRKVGNQSNPQARVEIRQGGGGVVTTVIPDTIITSTTILSGTWDAQSLLGVSGEDVEVRVYGTGAAGGAVEIGAVEWNATWVAAPPPSGREHYDWVGATGW